MECGHGHVEGAEGALPQGWARERPNCGIREGGQAPGHESTCRPRGTQSSKGRQLRLPDPGWTLPIGSAGWQGLVVVLGALEPWSVETETHEAFNTVINAVLAPRPVGAPFLSREDRPHLPCPQHLLGHSSLPSVTLASHPTGCREQAGDQHLGRPRPSLLWG